ncbi:hypothetical protein H5410_003511 [Solanum commersonii]|uniref:Uncharacterized protein n=1 Tax=Solanum commersonii TaxID=4109 RepID=A0A9J6B5A9_SOLCO|nr:hypothetical protein H5410_003511 [Solanum commersonii]
MKKGIISKSEAIALYMEEVKRDLMKNLYFDIKDDTSMASGVVRDICREKGQDIDDEEEDLETILKRYQKQMEESSTSTTDKGRNKI